MENTVFNFEVRGGIYPGNYRSTSVQAEAFTLEDAQHMLDVWCKKYFPDMNHYAYDFYHKIKFVMNTATELPVFRFGRQYKF